MLANRRPQNASILQERARKSFSSHEYWRLPPESTSFTDGLHPFPSARLSLILSTPPMRSLLLFVAVVASVGLLGCSSSQQTQSAAPNGGDTVNTGYGEQDESTSTSSSSTVRPSEDEASSAGDLASLVEGSTAGVQVSSVGGGIKVSIRGARSFSTSNTPLYVVDGTRVSPMSNGAVSVNPQNVESITILKDGSATSMYGSRGANGVVVIETKGN